MATKKKTARRKPMKRTAMKKKAAPRRAKSRKAAPRKAAPAKKRSAVARVKRVTREVVQQAQGAVAAGVETLKDFGETLVDRVRA
jgi:hypothetical protein